MSQKTPLPERQVEGQPVTREEVERWLQLSHQAHEPQAVLEYAQRAMAALPEDSRVQESVQRSVLEALNHDAFAAFLAETDKNYVITLRQSRPIIVPKARAQPEIFPPPHPTEGERALGMVGWMTLGLLPVGLGALILCPVVLHRALGVLGRRDAETRERRLGWLAMILASGLGGLGLLLTTLFVFRVIG